MLHLDSRRCQPTQNCNSLPGAQKKAFCMDLRISSELHHALLPHFCPANLLFFFPLCNILLLLCHRSWMWILQLPLAFIRNRFWKFTLTHFSLLLNRFPWNVLWNDDPEKASGLFWYCTTWKKWSDQTLSDGTDTWCLDTAGGGEVFFNATVHQTPPSADLTSCCILCEPGLKPFCCVEEGRTETEHVCLCVWTCQHAASCLCFLLLVPRLSHGSFSFCFIAWSLMMEQSAHVYHLRPDLCQLTRRRVCVRVRVYQQLQL